MREELPVKEAILDGEVVALDSEGRQNFRDLTAGRGNLHYAAFDALWSDGKDLRGLPLTRRKRALTSLVPATTTVVSQVFSIEGRGRDLFAAVQRLDLEGIVAKRKADPDRPETVWYKIKNRTYTQAEGRWELFQKATVTLYLTGPVPLPKSVAPSPDKGTPGESRGRKATGPRSPP